MAFEQYELQAEEIPETNAMCAHARDPLGLPLTLSLLRNRIVSYYYNNEVY